MAPSESSPGPGPARPRRRWLRLVVALGVAGIATLALLEAGVAALVLSGRLATRAPLRTQAPYWRGDHPTLGVWREPDAEWQHTSPCFDVAYRTNAVGARDASRTPEADAPRVVVLGDSFFAGWGVAEDERLSNRLEAATGVPHLNFAMPHFGPYQALLTYTELASSFEHDAVILGVFPANDFLDLSFDGSAWLTKLDPGTRAELAQYRFRPYLVRDGEGWAHVQRREGRLRRWLRRHSYAFNAWLDGRRALAARGGASPPAPDAPRAELYDYDDEAFAVLEEVLLRFSRETLGKRLVVVLIPGQADLARYQRVAGDRLTSALRRLGRRRGFEVVSLLPGLGAVDEPWRAWFHGCDFHWNARGHEEAARLLREALGPDFYRGLGAPR